MWSVGVSPATYVDEPILMDVNGNPAESNNCDPDNTGDEVLDRRYFYHQDRNWNVLALSEYGGDGAGTNGRIAERYSFTPYGEFVVLKGDAGSGELGAVRLASGIGNALAVAAIQFDHATGIYQYRSTDRSLVGGTLQPLRSPRITRLGRVSPRDGLRRRVLGLRRDVDCDHPETIITNINPPPPYDEDRCAGEAAFNCYPSDDPTGPVHEFNWKVVGECTAQCVFLHEAVHERQQTSCCEEAWKWICKGEDPGLVAQIYYDWVVENAHASECAAYGASVLCDAVAIAAMELTHNYKCCCLYDMLDFDKGKMNDECGQAQPVTDCAFYPYETATAVRAGR